MINGYSRAPHASWHAALEISNVERGNLVTIGLISTLCNCAVDSQISYMPDIMKQPAPKVDVKQPPDVSSIVHGDLSAVFVAASAPNSITFSPPIPARDGGWTTCIRAAVSGATGRPLGIQTFLVNIEQGRVEGREHVDDRHWCNKETYKPL
jgi:hypothetical protein